MIYRGLAITGTDTGVGKTTVARAMVSLLVESGRSVGVLKPVETGCEGEDLRPADAVELARSAGFELCLGDGDCGEEEIHFSQVVPWRFPDPLSPEDAARLQGVEITVDRIYQAMNGWMERSEVVVVETAGGLMVPINSRFSFADLLQGLELPVILVAANRLGVINHTLLTLEAMRNRKLNPLAVVLNRIDLEPDASADLNADAIRRNGLVEVIETPAAGAGEDPVEAVKKTLEPRIDDLLRAMEDDWRGVLMKYAGKK